MADYPISRGEEFLTITKNFTRLETHNSFGMEWNKKKTAVAKKVRFDERVTVFRLEDRRRPPQLTNKLFFAFAMFLFVLLTLRGLDSDSRRLTAAADTIDAIKPNLRATAAKLNEARAAFLDRF